MSAPKVPNGLPFGNRQAVEDSLQVAPLPQPSSPVVGATPPAPAGGGAGTADILGAVAGFPTERPDEAIFTTPQQAERKRSMLQILASLPDASDEIRTLAAEMEQLSAPPPGVTFVDLDINP